MLIGGHVSPAGGLVNAFQRGVERIEAGPGDTVILPRGIQHGFAVTSSQARVLLFITPGGLEEAFRATSTPTDAAPGDDAPTPTGPPAPEEIERLTAAYAAHGVEFTGPPLPALFAQGA